MYVQHVTICNVNPRISGLVCFIQIYTVYQYKPLNWLDGFSLFHTKYLSYGYLSGIVF